MKGEYTSWTEGQSIVLSGDGEKKVRRVVYLFPPGAPIS
jgi:hypothetical protein